LSHCAKRPYSAGPSGIGWPGDRQLAAGVDVAKKHVGDGQSRFRAALVCHHHGVGVLHVGRAQSDGPAGDHDDNNWFAGRLQGREQPFLAGWESGRRIVARFWDETLPIEQRLAKASAPAGWADLAQAATASRGGI